MSRIMGVRNDEELKNLRKIGIVGVRYSGNPLQLRLTNRMHSQSLNQSLWSGIPCKQVTPPISLLLTIFFSRCRVQLLRHCSLHFPNTLNCRHHLPGDLVVYASSVPTRNGEFLLPKVYLDQSHPILQFAMVISNLVEAIVSVKRISSFLDSDELQTDARNLFLKDNIQTGDEVLSITNGEFFWSKDGKEPTLQDINLTARKGELTAILGSVGAGKASDSSFRHRGVWGSDRRISLSRVACCLPLSER